MFLMKKAAFFSSNQAEEKMDGRRNIVPKNV